MERISDQISIEGLEVFARHGVMKEENVLGQKFLLSARLYCDVRKAGQKDDLEASVDYSQVCWLIKKEAEENTFRLIESLAEHLAEKILSAFPALERVDIRVEKPWAPVGLPLKNVAVEISRGWHQAYLSLGSNLGDRKENLDCAVELLRAEEKNCVERVSGYIETKPVGPIEQGDFLNAALALRTQQTPQELLEQIGQIEKRLKRVRTVHWGPRTIDIDILLYDDLILHTQELTIPHREMARRAFVLEPMCEIAPYQTHPANGRTMEELLRELRQA